MSARPPSKACCTTAHHLPTGWRTTSARAKVDSILEATAGHNTGHACCFMSVPQATVTLIGTKIYIALGY
jgi:hypothetical protein